mgnify:CR=1 FL=1
MAAFPDDPVPTFSYVLEPEWKTVVTPFDSGKEQRRKKWTYAKYNVRLSYYGLASTASENLWRFYQARGGSYEAFHFFDPLPASSHVGLYVGGGDGDTTAFSLPGKEITNETIYINGSSYSSADYNISTGAGADGSDLLNFSSGAPGSTDVITCDFNGKLRVRCRFEADNLTRENFEKSLFSYGITLKGLAPA